MTSHLKSGRARSGFQANVLFWITSVIEISWVYNTVIHSVYDIGLHWYKINCQQTSIRRASFPTPATRAVSPTWALYGTVMHRKICLDASECVWCFHVLNSFVSVRFVLGYALILFKSVDPAEAAALPCPAWSHQQLDKKLVPALYRSISFRETGLCRLNTFEQPALPGDSISWKLVVRCRYVKVEEHHITFHSPSIANSQSTVLKQTN